MFSIEIPATTSLREKAPYILANATFLFAGLGIATAVIALGKVLGQAASIFG